MERIATDLVSNVYGSKVIDVYVEEELAGRVLSYLSSHEFVVSAELNDSLDRKVTATLYSRVTDEDISSLIRSITVL